MSALLSDKPYEPRDEKAFLAELQALTQHHREHCPPYAAIVGDPQIKSVEDLPFVHVGLFKHLLLQSGVEGAKVGRTLNSSSTSGTASAITLDSRSSALQSESSRKILTDYLGEEKRPLVILDSARSLRQRNLSARVAAAMSLRFLASKVVFLLEDALDPSSFRFDLLQELMEENDEIVLYGFSWILWQAWAQQSFPQEMRSALERTRFRMVHSGGWKKLEAQRVSRERFDEECVRGLRADSTVLDYYGLVEQVGIVYPLCPEGYRHVPRWADVLVRDSRTLESQVEVPGQLQLVNTLAWGAPYHSVLTEDVGIVHAGPCSCGRSGKRFSLLNRLPKSEVRGCANV